MVMLIILLNNIFWNKKNGWKIIKLLKKLIKNRIININLFFLIINTNFFYLSKIK